MLTNVKIKGLKPKDKRYRVSDGNNLYLMILPSGGKVWRVRFTFAGKRKEISLGTYPEVSLKDARKKRLEIREQLAKGINPAMKEGNTFQAVASEWWKSRKEEWSKGHAALTWRRLEKNIFPWIGHRPVSEITSRELLEALRKIEARGAIETARRICQVCGQIFLYGVACGYCENNIANGLTTALKKQKPRNFAAITDPAKMRTLLRDIDAFEGHFVVKSALQLAPLVFVRPGELRKAEWKEIDLENAMWLIPAERMKKKRPHLVPLSRQAVKILKDLYPLTGHGTYVFPSVRTDARPISENTLNVALRRLGYSKEEMTAHGFRTMASTRLHEMGWKSEVIEKQLAHADKNKVRGVYNKAQYLDERKRMMQAWADYLDGLKRGAEVIPLERRA